MSGEVKGTVFRENRVGYYTQACDEQIKKFNFLAIFNLKSLIIFYLGYGRCE
jgi:hypothetical protein